MGDVWGVDSQSPHACRVVFTVAAALLFENPPVHQPPSHEHANGGIQQPLLSQVTHETWPATLQIDRLCAMLTALYQCTITVLGSSNGSGWRARRVRASSAGCAHQFGICAL